MVLFKKNRPPTPPTAAFLRYQASRSLAVLKADRREKRDDREGLKRLQQALKVRRENDEEMGGHTVDGCEILHHPVNNWIKNLSTAAGGLPSAVFLIVSNLDILDVPTLEPTKSKIGSLSELKKSYLL